MPRPDDDLRSDQRWLRRHARRVARSPGSVDDLVQETYLTALSKPPPDGPMRPWLLGVLRRLAWGEARSDRRRSHREDLFHRTEPSIAEPDPLVTYGVDPARLRASVARLPEPFRSTVEQRFIEGLSCAEIARAAGVPAGTVRWRQSRALELLRAELDPPARARRGLLWLPFVGLERAAAVGRHLVTVPGRRGALALVGAALLLVVAALGADEPGREPVALAALSSPSSPSIVRESAGAGAVPSLVPASEATFASLAPEDVDDEEPFDLAATGLDDDLSRRSSRASGAAAPDGPARELYDCADVDGELRCERRPVPADGPGGPVCAILERSLRALERGLLRAPRALALHGETFLHAARLADHLLAAELGCALVYQPDEEKKGGGGGGGEVARREAPRDAVEPTCRSDDDGSGRTCTTCTDERGAETTVCAPVECEAATRTDGAPCTTCTDADGQVESDCEIPPPTGCDQVLGGLDVFTLEILPILAGDMDLNDPEGEALTGCVRGPCHGRQRPGGFMIDVAAAPEENLARFACFVDLASPEASQILVCPTGDERCRVRPHPGGEWGRAEDLNYQRLLAYIRAAGP